jgi:hypothetical protein
MLSLPPSVRIFVAVEATDMRKSFAPFHDLKEGGYGAHRAR